MEERMNQPEEDRTARHRQIMHAFAALVQKDPEEQLVERMTVYRGESGMPNRHARRAAIAQARRQGRKARKKK